MSKRIRIRLPDPSLKEYTRHCRHCDKTEVVKARSLDEADRAFANKQSWIRTPGKAVELNLINTYVHGSCEAEAQIVRMDRIRARMEARALLTKEVEVPVAMPRTLHTVGCQVEGCDAVMVIQSKTPREADEILRAQHWIADRDEGVYICPKHAGR